MRGVVRDDGCGLRAERADRRLPASLTTTGPTAMTIVPGPVWLLSGAVAASVPAPGSAPAGAFAEPRRGSVAPAAGGVVSIDEIVQAVRQDATAVWRSQGVVASDGDDAPVAAVQALTWPDGSMGCGVPGRAYTQALVPGWRIEVRVGQRLLVYHASRRGQWLVCPFARSLRPPAAPPDR